MQEGNKLPLKRVELSLTKFNEVAIPHHLNLLRQHKANIIKVCIGTWLKTVTKTKEYLKIYFESFEILPRNRTTYVDVSEGLLLVQGICKVVILQFVNYQSRLTKEDLSIYLHIYFK